MADVINVDSSTLTINGTVIRDFILGDFIEVAFPNNLSERINGADNSVTVIKRVDAYVTDLTFRVKKFGEADIYLTSLRNTTDITTINGSLKSNVRVNGVERIASYTFVNGSFTTQPTDTNNNETPNDTMEYVIQFRQSIRQV
jgi:hypothetical protein